MLRPREIIRKPQKTPLESAKNDNFAEIFEEPILAMPIARQN